MNQSGRWFIPFDVLSIIGRTDINLCISLAIAARIDIQKCYNGQPPLDIEDYLTYYTTDINYYDKVTTFFRCRVSNSIIMQHIHAKNVEALQLLTSRCKVFYYPSQLCEAVTSNNVQILKCIISMMVNPAYLKIFDLEYSLKARAFNTIQYMIEHSHVDIKQIEMKIQNMIRHRVFWMIDICRYYKIGVNQYMNQLRCGYGDLSLVKEAIVTKLYLPSAKSMYNHIIVAESNVWKSSNTQYYELVLWGINYLKSLNNSDGYNNCVLKIFESICYYGNVPFCEYLLSNDVVCRTFSYRTSDLKIINILKQYDCKYSYHRDTRSIYDCYKNEMKTLISHKDYTKFIEMFLTRNYDIDHIDYFFTYGDEYIVHFLIENGYRPNSLYNILKSRVFLAIFNGMKTLYKLYPLIIVDFIYDDMEQGHILNDDLKWFYTTFLRSEDDIFDIIEGYIQANQCEIVLWLLRNFHVNVKYIPYFIDIANDEIKDIIRSIF